MFIYGCSISYLKKINTIRLEAASAHLKLQGRKVKVISNSLAGIMLITRVPRGNTGVLLWKPPFPTQKILYMVGIKPFQLLKYIV